MSYSIGELEKIVGMTTHGLRFYEKEGLATPKREGKNRVYSEEDKMWIEFLIHMKETGMSVKDMKKYTELKKLENPPAEELMQILFSHRKSIQEQLAVYQKNLEMLDKKIMIYRQEVKTTKGKDLYDHFVSSYDDFSKNLLD
ncbi:MerR family transcriptional regulator [Tetragenococcus muriaticus]|uniref:MerR family transcriptional regulator n=2 Tax=Tetragenococcus muriaticus TaxID=64642 RepID=A0A091C491_9ENTE|nr:MerR family transcriptional regulator [Tetragenococcus muriaticus]KFN91500.1 MerR family transcriptional regulator [Tetragenococcus muriaticus 3MR10-3]KFN91933.1 MerR family transcriptional regulator [Tetragenococcus muriaticus PMC-11-5]GMA46694.1 MerR family transcriptional regulator [Tetragenococcus muriaticus]